MNPLIKWPGGKSGEIDKIEHLIPKYDRYIEPFFGGGALFFHLNPKAAVINDISQALIEYYRLIKEQDTVLYNLLMCYNNSFSNLQTVCAQHYDDIYDVFKDTKLNLLDKVSLNSRVAHISTGLSEKINSGFNEQILLNETEFAEFIIKMVSDKILRTVENNEKRPFSDEDLKSNLITGFTSGYYMYFRKIFNDINLGRIEIPSIQYKAANFYFIREYCYGSMFRYNASGEFNIPYGGMSYNSKNMRTKIDNMFNREIATVFRNTEIECEDFEQFLRKANLKELDFMFLDPPYDTEFSDYEGNDFTKVDQERLANSLRNTMARFILIIKNTEFIKKLYENGFNILSFDNQYTYNVRSRNERNTEHLIITNIPV